MSSSCVESGASSPPPLSATRSSSTVPTISGGITATTASTATAAATTTTTSSGPQSLRNVHPQHHQPSVPHPQQHVDPAIVFTLPSSSSGADFTHGYGDTPERYRERSTGMSISGAEGGGLYHRDNAHWGSRPPHVTVSPSLTPRPEKLINVMVAAAAASASAAAAGPSLAKSDDDGAPLGGSSSSQQNRPSSSDPEMQMVDAGASATALMTTTTTPPGGINVTVVSADGKRRAGSNDDNNKSRKSAASGDGVGLTSALAKTAAAPLLQADSAAAYRVLLPISPDSEAAHGVLPGHSPHERDLLKTSLSQHHHNHGYSHPHNTGNNNATNTNTSNGHLHYLNSGAASPSPAPSQTRSLAPITSVASASTLSRKSNASTPLSSTRAVPIIGAWVPYTPPGPEADPLRPRDGWSGNTGVGGTFSTTTTMTTTTTTTAATAATLGGMAAYPMLSSAESEMGAALNTSTAAAAAAATAAAVTEGLSIAPTTHAAAVGSSACAAPLLVRRTPAPPSFVSPPEEPPLRHDSPEAVTLTPSEIKGEGRTTHHNVETGSLPLCTDASDETTNAPAIVPAPAAAAAVAGASAGESGATPPLPILISEEEEPAVAPRRVKRRPPSLFTASPVGVRSGALPLNNAAPALAAAAAATSAAARGEEAPTTTTAAGAADAAGSAMDVSAAGSAAGSRGSPSGRLAVVVPSNRVDEAAEVAASHPTERDASARADVAVHTASTGVHNSNDNGNNGSGEGHHCYSENATDSSAYASPLPLASRAESSKLLQHPQTTTVTTTSGTSGNSFGCTTTPTSAGEFAGEDGPPRFQRMVSSAHYTANPPSASPSPASTGLLTLISTTNGEEEEEEEEEEDRGVGRGQEGDDEYVERHPPRLFSQPPSLSPRQQAQHPPQEQQQQQQQQQQQVSHTRILHAAGMLAYSPPRPARVGPLMTPLNIASRKEQTTTAGAAPANANSQSSSLTSHSIVFGTGHTTTATSHHNTNNINNNNNANSVGASGPVMASSDTSMSSVPTVALHYGGGGGGGGSRVGSTTTTGGRHSISSANALSPSSGSFGAMAAHFGTGGYTAGGTGNAGSLTNVEGLGGRAGSTGTPSHSSFASPPIPGTTNRRGVRPPPLALTPTPTSATAAASPHHPTAASMNPTMNTTMAATCTTNNATGSAGAAAASPPQPQHPPANVSSSGSATVLSLSSPPNGPSASPADPTAASATAAATAAAADASGVGVSAAAATSAGAPENVAVGGTAAGGSIAPAAAAASLPTALPPPVRTTARRRAAPPSLFKVKSPTTEVNNNTSNNNNDSSANNTLSTTTAGACETSSEAVTSPKSMDPTSAGLAQRPSVTSVASLLSTPPLNARVPVAIMGTRSASENARSVVGSPGGLRTIGSSSTTTPNVNTNHVSGPAQGGMGGSLSARPHSGTSGGSNNALVRLSHDRRTLIAGMFRVSRDGCLTVRNMLLLNPTRIDAAANPTGCPHGSPLSSDARRPVQLLHPQRTNGINYSPVSSNGGAAGRMLMPHSGNGPATPNTAGSDWCSPQTYGPSTLGSVGFSRAGLGSGHRGPNQGFDMAVSNPNASFTLFSTSMDTPFSPITYSLDSQRLAFPNSSGYHHERGSALLPPPGPQLLRAVREENNNNPNANTNSNTLHSNNNNNHNHNHNGSSSPYGPGSGFGHHSSHTPHHAHHGNNETTPTTTAGNYLSASNTCGAATLGTTSGPGVGAGGTQAVTPNSITHSRAGGASNSLYRAQLRRQASSNWISAMPGSTNAASPTALQTAGSVGSMFGVGGGFNVPDTASSLLMPYADIPAWKTGNAGGGVNGANTGNGMLGVGPQTSSNYVGSPATHTNPNLGGSTGFTATSTAGMNSSQTGPHGFGTTQLPPNIVRLRDLEVLSTSVGEGASATVFVAIHKPTGRRLAVKRVDLSPLCLGAASSPYLRSGGGNGSGRIRQLMQIVIRELQVLHLTYRSPFMVKVYNAFFLPESAALDIVMEFMHYGSLDHLASALQKHARLARESQQQRNRLLYGDDENTGGGGGVVFGASPGSGSDRGLTSPQRNSDGTVAAVAAHSPLEHVLSLGMRSSSSAARTGSNGTAAGTGAATRGETTASTGTAAAHGSGGTTVPAPVSYLSPKMLNFGRNLDQQQVQLRGRRLGLTSGGPHDSILSPSTVAGGNASANTGLSNNGTAGSGAANNNTNHNNNEGDDDSLQMDTFSVKSNCGTDDTELDDGSGLMEEPYGVTERLVAVVGEQLLRGVRDMHFRGYIHRDIKPGNVLVNEHGVVKLSDFGLSQRCDDSGTGIKNPAMSFVPPPSTMPTRTNTPMHSPSMSALPLGSNHHHSSASMNINNNNNSGALAGSGGGWAQRQRSTAFSPYANRPLTMHDNVPHNPLCMGAASPEFDSSSEGGVLLSSSMTNSVVAQRDGMDVLDAESTSSDSDAERGPNNNNNDNNMNASSSSSDAGGNCSGTDKYMSPERQRGESHGKPADIWAVGVTLAEFAVGEYPYNVDDIIDEFDRVARLEKPVNVLQFNEHRAAPLSTVFADFIHLATLPIASQRPTAQELLEHPFFKQWHKPFNLKDYLATRVLVPSNQLKSEYLEKHRDDGH